MNEIDRQAACSKGGKRAHAIGKAHEWTSAEARAAGRKGAETNRRKARERAAASRVAQ